MAESRRNPKRKEKLLKYKQSKKKTEMSKLPDMNLRQVPTWNSTDEFSIQGVELEALYGWYSQMAPAFMAIQQIFARGIRDQKIKVQYEREDGTPVSDADVKAYTEQLNKFFKNKAAEKNDNVAPKDEKDEKASSEALEAIANEAKAQADKPEAKVIQMT